MGSLDLKLARFSVTRRPLAEVPFPASLVFFPPGHPVWTRAFFERDISALSGKNCQGKYLRIISAESPVKLYCCYGVIAVLSGAVIALSVALLLSRAGKPEEVSNKNIYYDCPRDWIGVGSKRFYFSEKVENWTSSQTFCVAQGAQLARFDSPEELEFLNRYKGTFDYWIGLHRESPEHPWMWTDNTEYYGPVLIGGVEEYAYLNNNGISSARVYADRRWICSKPSSYALQCQIPLLSF
ncbi:C-type lectin domain family 2 member D11-like isoform X1 [Cricetulus griseus]|uniref:C-type lectin domain family 2 member D11-like isoform X1 n=1 Tax=Cricetulus griseus TaxID=10029 RepID=UPI0015C349BE|nr:C-type lectin domain family 2 member D11-like isoform X1 [Cricetulus griseus]